MFNCRVGCHIRVCKIELDQVIGNLENGPKVLGLEMRLMNKFEKMRKIKEGASKEVLHVSHSLLVWAVPW